MARLHSLLRPQRLLRRLRFHLCYQLLRPSHEHRQIQGNAQNGSVEEGMSGESQAATKYCQACRLIPPNYFD